MPSRHFPHPVYKRPDNSRVTTRTGARIEFMRHRQEAAQLYGPVRACKRITEKGLCNKLFRSADPDEAFCADCLYKLYVLPEYGSRNVQIHHPQYDR